VNATPNRADHFRRRISWHEIEESSRLVDSIFTVCVDEDLGNGQSEVPWQSDLTCQTCNIKTRGNAAFVAREDMVICGLNLPDLILPKFGCKELNFTPQKKDGDFCPKGDCLGILRGPTSQILAAERTLLNFMQRLSGVATKSAGFVKILAQYDVGLLDTRKTTPGLRIFEKYATATGGSYNHRMGLFDQILIKDNHLASAGVSNNKEFLEFLTSVKERAKDQLVEVEIDDLARLKPSIEGGVDAVLLDNFSPEEVAQAVKINQNRVVLEASGGINEENLVEYANAGPHFVSTGAPVHQARWVDIGLDWID